MITTAPVITIDGPSGSGKGTVAALLAGQLGWKFLDSGALYRLVACPAPNHRGEVTNEEAFKELQEQMEQLRSEHFRNFDERFNFQQEQTGGYERKLRHELMRDGYLSEDEDINSLEWNDDSFRVNGKAISPEHQHKYKELNDQFFGRREQAGKVH